MLEKLATIQMLDVCLPTTDGRRLVMPRYTQPEPEQTILLHNMRHLKIIVPRDCCAARTAREHGQALEHIGAMDDARVVSSPSLRLKGLYG